MAMGRRVAMQCGPKIVQWQHFGRGNGVLMGKRGGNLCTSCGCRRLFGI